jgi:hypothetical protein
MDIRKGQAADVGTPDDGFLGFYISATTRKLKTSEFEE